MKVLKETINIDKYYHELAEIIIHPDQNNLVFIDTNILIWLYRLNNESFNEFSKFLNELSSQESLVIPTWVVHEYNNLLITNSEIVFFPFKKRLKTLDSDINHLTEIARLLADNEFSKKHGFSNKREFIKEIQSETESLKKKIRILNDKNNFKNEKRREYIEELITKNCSNTKIKNLLNKTKNFDFRFSHQIPPGFEDNTKISNKYGDLLIWKDIILNCKKKKSEKNLFISLDLKRDWVYYPQKIIKNGNFINNNIEPKFHYIAPWLEQEFFDETNENIIFSDVKLLVDILYSPDYNMMDFENFKNLAKTADIELNNNETNQVIEWLIVNNEKLQYLRNTICNWQVSPGEVDIEELKKWAVSNINLNIDFQKADWNNIFVQLFI